MGLWEVLFGRPADSTRVPCSRCHAMILPQTAQTTGGLCKRCHLAAMPPRRKPRAQHYIFAHKLVPSPFSRDPGGFVGSLAQEGNRLLSGLWVEAARLAGTATLDTATDAIDLPEVPASELRNLQDGTRLFVLMLPEPIAALDAFFVGLLVPGSLDSSAAIASVYTLELSEDHHRKRGTMLCGWSAEGAHVNYYFCPPPSLEAFVTAVGHVRVGQRASG